MWYNEAEATLHPPPAACMCRYLYVGVFIQGTWVNTRSGNRALFNFIIRNDDENLVLRNFDKAKASILSFQAYGNASIVVTNHWFVYYGFSVPSFYNLLNVFHYIKHSYSIVEF
jgi:hypothetical protein